MITFEEYMQLVIQEDSKWRTRRHGQNFFNVLFRYKPALCRSIMQDYPMFDPFYDDNNLARFVWHVIRCWDQEWTNSQEWPVDRPMVSGTNQGHSRRWLDG